MIIIKLSGGLGNQLFQYSFGRYLAEKKKVKIKFDLNVNIDQKNFTKREFNLHYFNINLDLASEIDIKSYRYFNNGILSQIERKLNQFFVSINRKYVVENSHSLLSSSRFIDNCYYDGYWQSEYYFKPIENILRKELEFNLNLDKQNIFSLTEIKKSNSVSLHIRRGDYVSVKANKSIFSELNLQYYEKAITFFRKSLDNPTFYIFSDDIEFAKKNFIGDSFKFIDFNKDNPIADLYLMSRCANNVIANSTFSWWGAWLNSNKDKIVIAPHSWYKNPKINSQAIKNILPESWIKI